MTREEIEQLNGTEPYSFETDREELWYKIGLKVGLETADQHPREGLWDSEKVITWIALHAELYGGFNQGKLNLMCEDLTKAMED